MQTATAAGCAGILVRTGYGASQAAAHPAGVSPPPVVDNLLDGVGWILRHPPQPRRSDNT